MRSIIAPEEMARYRAGARGREAARLEAAERRRQAGWRVARRAANLLRTDFGAARVIAFGSLVDGTWFHARSDIDLAVEGLPRESFWRAGSVLDHLDPAFEIDLITIEDAPDFLRDEIARGVEL